MLEIETPEDLKARVGQELGVSDWLLVDQARIDRFAEATNDFQWIHVDPERAARELPGGTTIAHGFLTLSLVAGLPTFEILRTSRMINYGANRVRFTNMVPAGSRVRVRQRLAEAEDVKGGGVRVVCESTVEIEGQERPALVAETIMIAYA